MARAVSQVGRGPPRVRGAASAPPEERWDECREPWLDSESTGGAHNSVARPACATAEPAGARAATGSWTAPRVCAHAALRGAAPGPGA
eukprot:10297590-Alexandrium_andersonii.AAC.1